MLKELSRSTPTGLTMCEKLKRRIDMSKDEIEDLEGQLKFQRERLSMLQDAKSRDSTKIVETKRAIEMLNAKLAKERSSLEIELNDFAAECGG